MLVRIEAERVLEVFESELEQTLLRLDDLALGVAGALASGLLESEADRYILSDIEAQVERGKKEIRLARAEAALLLEQA